MAVSNLAGIVQELVVLALHGYPAGQHNTAEQLIQDNAEAEHVNLLIVLVACRQRASRAKAQLGVRPQQQCIAQFDDWAGCTGLNDACSQTKSARKALHNQHADRSWAR